ncbi:hypothetical protein CL634_00685 [bacterium]|nr:hypothetical protein [bacterium]
MAIAQTSGQAKSIAEINPKSTDGYQYVSLGTIWIVVGSGAPATSCADAPAGSLYIRSQESTGTASDSDIYIKKAASGTGTWESLRGD